MVIEERHSRKEHKKGIEDKNLLVSEKLLKNLQFVDTDSVTFSPLNGTNSEAISVVSFEDLV